MGKTFIKGFGFVDDNDDIVPRKKLAKKNVNDLPDSEPTKERVADVDRVVKSRKSK